VYGAPGSQVIGDIDGDGTPDIVRANAATNAVGVALGNGRGGFRAPLVYAVNSDGTPIRLAVGDLDGDGRADLVTINYSGGYITNSVSVLLDDEHGGFRRAAGYHVGRGPILGGAIGALTASGHSDIVALDTNNGNIEILLNDGRGHFHVGTSPLGFPLGGGGSRPVDAAIGDLTGDGKADIAVIFPAFDYSIVGVFPGDGHGGAGVRTTTQCGVPPQKKNKVGPLAYALAIGDVDGDGTPDIVTANASGSVSVLRGDGHGSFGTAVSYPVGIGAASVTLGDFNGDGTLDIVTANAGSSGPVLGEVPSGVTPGHTVSVLLNDGHGHFRPAVAYPVGVGPRSVAVGDINGDGKPDIITANFGGTTATANLGRTTPGDTVSVLLNDGHGHFGPAVAYPVGVGPRSVAVGDVNGDSKPDIVTANSTEDYGGESVTVLLNRS
jgi:hypothetical protein